MAGADESGFYVNGKLNWAWILQNPKLTLTWIAKGRGAKEFVFHETKICKTLVYKNVDSARKGKNALTTRKAQ